MLEGHGLAMPAAGLSSSPASTSSHSGSTSRGAGISPATTNRIALAFYNSRTRTLVNTRQPMRAGGLGQGRALLTMLQPGTPSVLTLSAIFLGHA